jgi:pyruvoyl-dependent arginine decarboxylase (PvlArgDC)
MDVRFTSLNGDGDVGTGTAPVDEEHRHRSSFDFGKKISSSNSTNGSLRSLCSLPVVAIIVSVVSIIFSVFSYIHGAGSPASHSFSPPAPSSSFSSTPSSSGGSSGQARHVFGPRIPRHFFFTSGIGKSDVGVETGSFDDALFNASIADMNIMKYTSVLPRESSKIKRSEASLHHGAVLECIMAQADGNTNDVLTAGILTKRMRRKLDGLEIGGYVVEYPSSDAGVPGIIGSGVNVTSEDALANLEEAMEQLLVRRHGEKYMDMYEVYDHWHYVESMLVTDSKFGSVIVALGFVDWIFPEGTDQRIDYRVKYGRFQSDL